MEQFRQLHLNVAYLHDKKYEIISRKMWEFLQRIVVFPALSIPRMRIRCSLDPHNYSKTFEKTNPIYFFKWLYCLLFLIIYYKNLISSIQLKVITFTLSFNKVNCKVIICDNTFNPFNKLLISQVNWILLQRILDIDFTIGCY